MNFDHFIKAERAAGHRPKLPGNPQEVADNLGKAKRAIIEAIDALGGQAESTKIAAQTSMALRNCRQHLLDLKSAGLVRVVKQGSGGSNPTTWGAVE